MPINIANLGVSANPDISVAADGSSYSGTSWTPPSAGALVLDVYTRASTVPNLPQPNGNSLVFSQLATVNYNTVHRLTRFVADLNGSSEGITGLDFGGQVQIGCSASFYYISGTGVDLSNGVTGAFIQSNTNSGNSATGSVVMSPPGNPDNRVVAGFSHAANESTTPKSGFTELDDLSGAGPLRDLQTSFREDSFDTDPYATWATPAPWGGIASEVKATQAAGGLAQPIFSQDIQSVLFGGQVVR